MKRFKRLTAFALAVVMLFSTISILNNVVLAEDIQKDFVYSTETKYTEDDNIVFSYSNMKIKANIATSQKRSYGFKYVYMSDAADAYVIYESSKGAFDDFYFESGVKQDSGGDFTSSAVQNFYKIYYSSDNSANSYVQVSNDDITLGATSFSKASYGTANYIYKKINVDLPATAKYVKIVFVAENYLISRVGYWETEGVQDKVPTIRATVNDNAFPDGSISYKNPVKVTIKCEETYNTVVKREGLDYAWPEDGIFTESGSYEITSSTEFGSATFNFSIVNGGKIQFESEIEPDLDALYSSNEMKLENSTNTATTEGYFYYPETTNADFVVKGDTNFQSFYIETINCDKPNVADRRTLDTFEDLFKVYVSKNGKNYTQTTFTVDSEFWKNYGITGGNPAHGSERLIVDVSAGVKYVKVECLVSGMLGGCRLAAVDWVEKETPKIIATVKDKEINDGDFVVEETVTVTVSSNYTPVTTVTRNGETMDYPADNKFTSYGDYVITAESVKGSSAFSFTIRPGGRIQYEAAEKVDLTKHYESAGMTLEASSKTWLTAAGHIYYPATAYEGTPYIIYKSERVFANFSFETVNHTKKGLDKRRTVDDFDDLFKFYISDDGKTYTETTFTVDQDFYAEYGFSNGATIHGGEKINVDLGNTTKYIKVEFFGRGHAGGCRLAAAEWTDKLIPKITATTENGEVKDGASIGSLAVTVDIDSETEVQNTITRNGKPYAFPAGGKFTEYGEYSIVSTNKAGTSSISFTILLGGRIQYEATSENKADTSIHHSEYGMSYEANTHTWTSLGNMFYPSSEEAYANNDAYVVYNSISGFKTFSYETATTNLTTIRTKEKIQEYFKFQVSADGETFTDTDFVIDTSFSKKYTNSTGSERLVVTVPNDTFYIKVICYQKGFNGSRIAAAEWTESLAPKITASTKYGNLADGKNAADTEVTIKIKTEDKASTVTTVTRNGKKYTYPKNNKFSTYGKYVVTSKNIYGISKFRFNINPGGRIQYESKTMADRGVEYESEGMLYRSDKNKWLTDGWLCYPKNEDAYIIYEAETTFESFTLDTVNHTSFKRRSVEKLAECYEFYTSADGKKYTKTTFHIDETFSGNYAYWYAEHLQKYQYVHGGERIDAVIPEGTKYVKVVFKKANHDGGSRLAATEWTEVDLSVIPTITGSNSDGVICDNGLAISEIKLNVKCTEDYTLTAYKNGKKITVPKNLTFKGEGVYDFIAENEYTKDLKDNSNTFNVTVVSGYSSSYVFTYSFEPDKPDDVAFEEHNMFQEGPSYTAETGPRTDAQEYTGSPTYYYMNQPDGYITFKSDAGFSTFNFYSDLYRGSGQYELTENNIGMYYKVYGSKTGRTFKELKVTLHPDYFDRHGSLADYWIIRKLICEVPEDIHYIKVKPISENTRGLTGINAPMIHRVDFSEMDAEYYPVIAAKTDSGVIIDGDIAYEDVTVAISCGYDYTLKVTKDGKTITLPKNKVLTEAGVYKFVAKSKVSNNLTFTNEFSFTIIQGVKKIYNFLNNDQGTINAWNNILKAPKVPATMNGEPTDSGTIKVNNDANNNSTWWGSKVGGSKLTTGADSSGWYENGYFYTTMSDEKGYKYSAFDITYVKADKTVGLEEQKLEVFVSKDGGKTFNLALPTISTMTDLPSAKVDQYYEHYEFGREGCIVKIVMTSDEGCGWEAGYMSIINITKIKIPITTVKAGGKTYENYDVIQDDATYSVKYADSVKVYKDDVLISKKSSGTLTEDGVYQIVAVNDMGTSTMNFVLAEENPTVVVKDINGAFVKKNAIAEDDVTIYIYNADKVTVTKNGKAYTIPKNRVIAYNGVYEITVTNKLGTAVFAFTLARPMPEIKATDFWGAELINGDTAYSYVTITVSKPTDTVVVYKEGKEISKERETIVYDDGDYRVVAKNKAGTTELFFTVKHFAPLPAMEHPGDTVVRKDYNIPDFNKQDMSDVHKTEGMKYDKTSGIKSDWTGLKYGVLNLNTSEIDQHYIIIHSCGFKSLGIEVLISPNLFIEDIKDYYNLYLSKDAYNYKEVDYTIEKDESYLSWDSGYKKYRLIPTELPEGTKYAKFEVIRDPKKVLHDYGVYAYEYSYDKDEYGIYDPVEVKGLINAAQEGDTIDYYIYNTDNVVTKDVFTALEYRDVTLRFNLLDDNNKVKYKLSFYGYLLPDVDKFNLRIIEGTKEDISFFGDSASDALFVSFAQSGDWGNEVTFQFPFGDNLTNTFVNWYSFIDGAWQDMGMVSILNGWGSTVLTAGYDSMFGIFYGETQSEEIVHEEVITEEAIPGVVIPEEEDTQIPEEEPADEVVEDDVSEDVAEQDDNQDAEDVFEEVIIEDEENSEVVDLNNSTANDKKIVKVTRVITTTLRTVWLVIFIVAGVLLLGGIAVGTIFLVKHNKKRKIKTGDVE